MLSNPIKTMEDIMGKKRLGFGIPVIMLVFVILVIGCKTEQEQELNSYTQADINVGGLLLHYYFSSTPEGIEKAAFDNGISYISPPIKNAMWELNPSLDINVKNAMDSRNVSYSATLFIESGIQYVIVNRKNNNLWYSTVYVLT
jgi:hypothetical protein